MNIKKKFESTNMGLVHFKILIFFRLFKYGGRVGKRLVANCSILLVQNSLHYLNIMTFESFFFFFFFFKTGMFQRIEN